MRPPAPGRLSTTICCFQIWVRRSATTRVATSGLLPAAAGVMNVTGLVGYSCACAGRLATMARAATQPAPNLNCRLRIGRSSKTELHTYASGRLPGRRHQRVPSIRERSERAFRKNTFPQCELWPIVNAVRQLPILKEGFMLVRSAALWAMTLGAIAVAAPISGAHALTMKE